MSDNKFFKRLNDSESLIDVLIQMEDFLDGLDLYVFKNWFDGEVVSGPEVSRYWTKMTLKFPYKEMPDPSGGLRLLKHGAKVFFRQAEEEVPVPVENPSDFRDSGDGPTGKPRMETEKIWLVDIHIPRRFIEDLGNDELEVHNDDDLDLDSLEATRHGNEDDMEEPDDEEEVTEPQQAVPSKQEQT